MSEDDHFWGIPLVHTRIAPVLERRDPSHRYSVHADHKRTMRMLEKVDEMDRDLAAVVTQLPWVVVDARGHCCMFATLSQAVAWSKGVSETCLVRGPFP